MMNSKENFNNFVSEAHPLFLELARISRKHFLAGENVSMWLDKSGVEVSASMKDGEVQGRQREYKYNYEGQLKVEDITSLKCEVGENG